MQTKTLMVLIFYIFGGLLFALEDKKADFEENSSFYMFEIPSVKADIFYALLSQEIWWNNVNAYDVPSLDESDKYRYYDFIEVHFNENFNKEDSLRLAQNFELIFSSLDQTKDAVRQIEEYCEYLTACKHLSGSELLAKRPIER
ncbi:MAG: hypothetical protein KC505_04390 [Myxococcales bacterium]|nr:hypothetical protein [Myxococcales bacterium]USN50604.1 MAG: hypothetical protein H6731_10130 [Myxococcales bacterium]